MSVRHGPCVMSNANHDHLLARAINQDMHEQIMTHSDDIDYHVGDMLHAAGGSIARRSTSSSTNS